MASLGMMSLTDYSLLFLRLVIAAIFYVHSHGKNGFWKMKPSPEMSAGRINFMRFISVAEMLGALALVLGFLTQFAAIGLGIIMCGAIYMKAKVWKTGFKADGATGWEFDLMILAGCVALLALGGGAISLDRIWLHV